MSDTVDILKQRLVGAFVILSLAVIFLPMLFDKPHREGAAVVEQVPPRPMRETVVISKPRASDYERRVVESEYPESKLPQLVPAQSLSKSSVQELEQTKAATDSSEGASIQAQSETKGTSETKPVVESSDVAKRPVETKVYNNVWMVQLGTFSKKENAFALRDKLRGLGIEGHTKPVKSGSAVRVFAGPFVTKKEALRIKRKVDAEFKVDSLVVFFEA